MTEYPSAWVRQCDGIETPRESKKLTAIVGMTRIGNHAEKASFLNEFSRIRPVTEAGAHDNVCCKTCTL